MLIYTVQLLKFVFTNHRPYQELINLFPCIREFIRESQSASPKDRPSLQSFCEQLNNQLNPNMESETASLGLCQP